MANTLQIAIGAYAILVIIALVLFLRPHFVKEGFTTIALDSNRMPKCFLRDAEAQKLLAQFESQARSESYGELKLILQKVLCIDADITGSAAGPYSTYQLPFATLHDIEPVASFVGRCVRKVVRERDIGLLIEKYDYRGSELIAQLCSEQESKESSLKQFRNILERVKKNISGVCVAPKANLDIPSGARDPGYYESESIQQLSPYAPTGGNQYF